MSDDELAPEPIRVELLHPYREYGEWQILYALGIAAAYGRGKFVLCETPAMREAA